MMERLFQLARELASPQAWSAGVEIARNSDFYRDEAHDADEFAWRIAGAPRGRVFRVILSEQNELWQCDCGSEDDPCPHVVGTILAVRQGRDQTVVFRAGSVVPATVAHVLSATGLLLSFERVIIVGDERIPVRGSLAQAVADLARSRRTVSLTEAEERIDHVLAGTYCGVLEPKTMRRLVPALSRTPHVEVDGRRVKVSAEPLAVEVEVVDCTDGSISGFRVRRVSDPLIERLFDNSAAIRSGCLHAVEDSSLSTDEIELLRGAGTFFPSFRSLHLATRLVPSLEAKVRVSVRSGAIPRARRVPPRVVISTRSDETGTLLTVLPEIVYGEPVIARVSSGELRLIDGREVPVREPLEEARLVRELSSRLSLAVGEAKVFRGEAAVHFCKRLKGWCTDGPGTAAFSAAEVVLPKAVGSRDGIEVRFEAAGGGVADSAVVLQAWRRGDAFVPLLGGGWGTIPEEWLAAHGEALSRIYSASTSGTVPRASTLADVAELCDSLGVACPNYFLTLRNYLEGVESIPHFQTPADLHADLRDYQRYGVNWLGLLRDNQIGALLADDMGLGKTLQTLAVLEGLSLIVCPTSVLASWRDQIARFRPGLKVSWYHGPQRTLDQTADVVLTSYGVLRLDQEVMSAVEWSTVVLDEAQTIRNPASQIAQAAYGLRAKWRVSLSGTPVENSLDDLWSQFNFLNPGLLGSYEAFQRKYSHSLDAGDRGASAALKSRVRPFILRRMKSEVARELPPKTEVELQCELSRDERVVYEAILGAARSEAVARLESGEPVFSVLEALLRLRQACCHTALLPGYSTDTSSKVELLVDTLLRSKSLGHRCLVFSQWTSLLNLIEPHLRRNNLTFSRIDGSTVERGSIVEAFQRPDGPDLMLLSLKAGGVGLTLTAADHVFIVDQWWNPAVEDQAADRAYRIGQENPVLVHRLIAHDTIEARIVELQRHKRGLLSSAVGGESGVGLSRDELLNLLSQ